MCDCGRRAREESQEQQLDRSHQWIDRHPVLQWLYCSIVIGYLGLTKASSVFLFLKLLALVLLVVIILLYCYLISWRVDKYNVMKQKEKKRSCLFGLATGGRTAASPNPWTSVCHPWNQGSAKPTRRKASATTTAGMGRWYTTRPAGTPTAAGSLPETNKKMAGTNRRHNNTIKNHHHCFYSQVQIASP